MINTNDDDNKEQQNGCINIPDVEDENYADYYLDNLEIVDNASSLFNTMFTSIAVNKIYDMNNFIINKKITISDAGDDDKKNGYSKCITLNFLKNNIKIDDGENFLKKNIKKKQGLNLKIYYLPKEVNNITDVKMEMSYTCLNKWVVNPTYNQKKIMYHEINECVENVEPTEIINGLTIKIPYYMSGDDFNTSDTHSYTHLFIRVSRVNCLFDNYLGSFYINLNEKHTISTINKNLASKNAYDELLNWTMNEEKKLKTIVKKLEEIYTPILPKQKIIKLN
jgi:hypothetical protein